MTIWQSIGRYLARSGKFQSDRSMAAIALKYIDRSALPRPEVIASLSSKNTRDRLQLFIDIYKD